MTEQHNKDLVLTSLDLVHGLADENSNLPAMHQIRLLTNDLIDLINGGIVEVKSGFEEVVLPNPPVPGSFLASIAQAAPPPQMAPPMQPEPWGRTPPPSQPTGQFNYGDISYPAAANHFVLDAIKGQLRGFIKAPADHVIPDYIVQDIYRKIMTHVITTISVRLPAPAAIDEDTLLLNALENELASPDTRSISFDKGLSPGIDVRNSEGRQKAFFHGKAREALRSLAEAHKPD